GLIWIPCVGPMLSGVLTMVATKGQILYGVVLLLFYSLGFAIPMLIMGYSSQALRQKIRSVQQYSLAIRIVSGSILIVFGLYILLNGILGFGW
ncbi:MAG: sulfite exporter TauE/SafE family protein, partial [Bacteroidetes bacterium]|nr:sulfite exporter TauE/SafE family protein [Bacteroidota bacterium]